MTLNQFSIEKPNLPFAVPIVEQSITKESAEPCVEIFGVVYEGESKGIFTVEFMASKKGSQPFLLALRIAMYDADTTVVLNTLREGSWLKEKRYHNFIRVGERFCIKIHILHKHYSITINNRHMDDYPHRLKPKYITSLNIRGDVHLDKVKFTDFVIDQSKEDDTPSTPATPLTPPSCGPSTSFLMPPPRPPLPVREVQEAGELPIKQIISI